MDTETISRPADNITDASASSSSGSKEIIQNNIDHTLFSWSKQKGLNPIAVEHAKGVYLYDYDGKK